MVYKQGMYNKMAGVKSPKMGSPDKGYGGNQSGHYAGDMKQRGNDYNKIQDKIDRKFEKRMKGQRYDNY